MGLSGNRRRRKIRQILGIIILATLPCYCLGFFALSAGRTIRVGTHTPTPSITVTSSVTPTATRTRFVFPTATPSLLPSQTWTPTETFTPFIPPTMTPTRIPPPTVEPTATITPTFPGAPPPFMPSQGIPVTPFGPPEMPVHTQEILPPVQ